MNETLRPLGDGVLVRLAKAEEKVGSIIVPDAAQKKPRRGEVLAVGPGVLHACADGSSAQFAPRVDPGDVVLFAEYAGHKVGDDLLLLKEADILAAVEPKRPPPCEVHDTSKAHDVPPVSLEQALNEATRTLPDGSTIPASTGVAEWRREWDKK